MSSTEFVITDAHKAFLSTVLTGTDDTAVLDAASRAAHTWGLSPDVAEPSEEQWSAAESATLAIIEAIVTGLEDGSVKVRASKKVTATPDPETHNILVALGVVV